LKIIIYPLPLPCDEEEKGMIVEIWTKNVETGKKWLVSTIKHNRVVEGYLASEKGLLERGDGKQMRTRDVYAMAGFASIYLHTYKEPQATSKRGITDTRIEQQIDEMRTTKIHAQSCIVIASQMLPLVQQNLQVGLKVR
jgi:hypothetical protein